MKKFLSLFLALGLFSLVACGPSAEEKEKAAADEKAATEEMFKDLEKEVEQTKEEVASELPADSAAHTEAPASH